MSRLSDRRNRSKRRPLRSRALTFEPLEARELLSIVSIVANDPDASEQASGGGSPDPGQFTVSRDSGGAAPLTVYYNIGGTATNGASGGDYSSLSGSVTIPAYATSATINISPVNDAIDEGDETVELTLNGSGGGYTVGSPSSATVTIADNDNWSVKVETLDNSAFEPTFPSGGGDPGRFRFTRYGETDLTHEMTVEVTFGGTATEGTDYNFSEVTIPAGEYAVLGDVDPNYDGMGDEGSESVTVTITSSAQYNIGSPSSATLTIHDTGSDNPRYTSPGNGVWPLRIAGQETDGSLAAVFAGPDLGYLTAAASPHPIVSTDVHLQPTKGSATLSRVEVSLNLDGVQSGTIYYSGSGVNGNDLYRFAVQVDAGSLSTGRHKWAMTITQRYSDQSTLTATHYGQKDIVKRAQSEYGKGWWPRWLDRLVLPQPSGGGTGLALVHGDGNISIFLDDAQGGYVGDPDAGTLTNCSGGAFALTQRDGSHVSFSSNGLAASRTDRVGQVTTYAYNDGDNDGVYDDLYEVTDPYDRTTTYTYSGGKVSQITDIAGRTTTLAYDGSGRLTSITQPDPDGGGELSAPVFEFGYNAANRLTSLTDANDKTTSFAYDFAGTLQTITWPLTGSPTRTLSSVQVQALVDLSEEGTSQNPAPLKPTDDHLEGTWVDELDNETTFQVDWHGERTTSTDPLQNTTTWVRNHMGSVVSFTDRLGRVTTYEYDSFNKLTQVTLPDPDGEGEQSSPVTSNDYNEAGHVTSKTDPLGQVTTYDYDESGNLTEMTLPDPDGSGGQCSPVSTYTYDEEGNPLTETDPRGNVSTYTYDEFNRCTEVTGPDPDGSGGQSAPVTQYTYDDAGIVTSMTDPLGGVTTSQYDNLDRLTSVTLPDPDGSGGQSSSVTSYTYDAVGNLLTVTDPRSNVTTYTYDNLNRRTQVTQPDPDGSGGQSAPVTTYAYDAAGRMTSMTDPLGGVTTYAYDNLGRQTSVTLPDPDGSGGQSSPVTSYTYDAVGSLLTETDPRGNVTTYTYDNLNRRTQVTQPDPDGSGGQSSPVITYAYDAAGRMTSMTDPLGGVTTYAYDNLGRNTSVTLPDPDGSGGQSSPVTSYTYNAVGSLLTVTDPRSDVTEYTYDNLNRRTTVTDAEDGVTSYTYDAVGNLSTVADPVEGVTTYAYDNLGRQTSVTGPDPDGSGGQSAPVTTYTYDAAGNVVSTDDALSHETTYEYDNLNRLTSVTDPETGATTYTYDAAGNTLTLTDPELNVTTWTYDALSRVIEEANELDDSRLFEYDAADNLTKRTDRNGRVVQYVYDDLNRLTSELWKNGETTVRTLSYTYDAASQMLTASDPAASYEYVYDNVGRATSVSATIDGLTPEVVLTQVFDAAGNRTSLAAQIGATDDFLSACTYDDLGRMTRVQQSGQSGGNSVTPKRVDFAYDAAGRFDTITRYANLAGTQLVAQTGYTYDDASRLTALTHSKGQTTLAGYTWTYDTKGRLTEYNSTIDGTATYTYDDTDQLTGADYSYQTDETYTYDANGNRTNTGYDTDANNRLASDGTYNYQYDDEGNRTKRTNIATGAVTEYTWDYRNRLTKVLERASAQGPATKVVEYSYDVFDRRVGKDVDDDGDEDVDRGERYVYDGQHIALQFDGDDDLTHRYLFGPAVDQILADEDASGDVLWSLADHQGTVRDLAEYDSGQDETTVVNHVKYDAFGNIRGQSNSSLTPHFAYTGREWDPDAGLYYYRARWYDPKTGRFVSEDPIGFAGGDANLYRYVVNRPLNFIDPTGCSGGSGGGTSPNPSPPLYPCPPTTDPGPTPSPDSPYPSPTPCPTVPSQPVAPPLSPTLPPTQTVHPVNLYPQPAPGNLYPSLPRPPYNGPWIGAAPVRGSIEYENRQRELERRRRLIELLWPMIETHPHVPEWAEEPRPVPRPGHGAPPQRIPPRGSGGGFY